MNTTETVISPYVFPGFKYQSELTKISPLNQMEMAEYYIKIICSYYGIDEKKIKGKHRMSDIVIARNICIYYIRRKTKMSLKRIGSLFSKDHTTIIHSLQTVKSQLSSKFNNQYKDDIEHIKKIIWIK